MSDPQRNSQKALIPTKEESTRTQMTELDLLAPWKNKAQLNVIAQETFSDSSTESAKAGKQQRMSDPADQPAKLPLA